MCKECVYNEQRLTLTRVVFKLKRGILGMIKITRLTLTRVVFK